MNFRTPFLGTMLAILLFSSNIALVQAAPAFNFSLFPATAKLERKLTSQVIRRVDRLEKKLRLMMQAVPEHRQQEAQTTITTWTQDIRKTVEAVQTALTQGDQESAFRSFYVAKQQLQNGRKFIRMIAQLIEEEEDEEDAQEFSIQEPPLAKVDRQLSTYANQALVDMGEKLQQALGDVPEDSQAIIKQYVEEWLEAARRFIKTASDLLEKEETLEAQGHLQALKAHLKNGHNLLKKLHNLAAQNPARAFRAPTAPMIVPPPSVSPEGLRQALKPFTEKRVEIGLQGLEERRTNLEQKLNAALTAISSDYLPDMKQHVETWSLLARETMQDVRAALAQGETEKAFGLKKALIAHLDAGLQLLKKLNRLVQEPPLQSVYPTYASFAFNVGANCYPNCAQGKKELLPNVFINTYRVQPVNATQYEGVLVETGVTGENGEPYTFHIQPGEMFDVLAFSDAGMAKSKTAWTFSVPPYKHFGAVEGSPHTPICQIRFTNADAPLITQMTGKPSCAMSMSIPVTQQNDHEGRIPARPPFTDYKEQKKDIDVAQPVDLYTREQVEKAYIQVRERFYQTEQQLKSLVELLAEDIRKDAAVRIEEWLHGTSAALEDVQQALTAEHYEKAYGLVKALAAHVDRGEELVQKFKGALQKQSETQPAHSVNLLEDAKWIFYDAVEQSADEAQFILREKDENRMHAFVDVPIDAIAAGSYALLISHTMAERLQPPLETGQQNIAGLPYLYGYFMSDDTRIIKYLQGQSMLHAGQRDGQWTTSFGLFRIPHGTKNIRFFLQQAERQGTLQDGRAATFAHPGLFLLSDPATAEPLLKQYQNSLP